MARSYYGRYRAPQGGLLLGGVPEALTSRFARRADAEQVLATALGLNKGAAGEVVPSVQPPEIFPHCLGSIPQAVGGRCFQCGKVLTDRDARQHRAEA